MYDFLEWIVYFGRMWSIGHVIERIERFIGCIFQPSRPIDFIINHKL